MGEHENVAVVERIYAAFGRGDLPTILNALTDDSDWEFRGPAEIPFAGKRRGRAQIARFFQTIAETVQVEQFPPDEIFAGQTAAIVAAFRGP